MTRKTDQLQIRITSAQKAQLKRAAARAGLDVSSYVLARALPPERTRVDAAIGAMREDAKIKFAVAELADAIKNLGPNAFGAAVEYATVTGLSPFAQNYAAAMIEEAAAARGLDAPAWTKQVAPLTEPWFATRLRNLRLHLLRVSPVPFKRRNLFIDASTDARV